MNFKAICLITLILLVFAPKKSFSYKPHLELSKKLSPLSMAYFFGQKSGLTKESKKAHQALNLQHLMTPSGLHLSALLSILGFFTKRKSIFFFALSLLGFSIFPSLGFSSFKRMMIFGLLKNNPIIKISNSTCFWATFITAFAFGMYKENPLSFTLSFLFLGALLSSGFKLQTYFTLFFAQAMISSWLNKDFYPIGSLYGLLLSLFSPLVFLSLIIENLFSSRLFSQFWLSTINFFSTYKGASIMNPIFILLPCYLIGGKPKLRRITLGFSIIFTALKLNPSFKSKSFAAMPPRAYITKKNIKGGVKLTYKNKMRCYSRLKMDEWSTHCY